MNDDPRYAPVAATLPATLPPLTRDEAARAARLICRHFGKVADGGPNMAQPVRMRSNWPRKCWLSPRPTTGHHRGWGRLIHDVSHWIFERRHPGFRPHAGGHARLEREIAAYVVGCGWLAGALVKAQAPTSRADELADRLARIEARIARWEGKRKRAETALRKLAVRRRYVIKAQEKILAAPNLLENC